MNALSELADLFGTLTAPLSAASGALKQFSTTVMQGVVELGAGLATAAAEVVTGLLSLSAGLAVTTVEIAAEFLALGVAVLPLTVVFAALGVALAALTAAIATAAAVAFAPLIAAGTLLALTFGALITPLTLVGAAVGAVIAPFIALGAAAAAITAPFQMLSSAVGPFVEALNPSIMQLFNESLRGLQATIGVALAPMMTVLAGAMRRFAGILLPMMQTLAPIIASLAETLTSALEPVLHVVADTFIALAPVIQLMANMVGSLGESFAAMAIVAATLLEAFIELIAGLFGGGDLKDLGERFRNAIQQMTIAIIKLVAYIAKAFGQMDFINKMIAAFDKHAGPVKPGATPAAKNVGIKGFESIGKDMAIAAFSAQSTGGSKEKKTEDFLKDIEATLKDIAGNNKTLQEFMDELMEQIMGMLESVEPIKAILDFLRNFKAPTYDDAKEAIHQQVKEHPFAAGIADGLTGGLLRGVSGLL